MPTPSDFPSDFYNNLAAIFIVLIFAKFVTHRSRLARHGPATPGLRWFKVAHVLAMVAAALGVLIALVATYGQSDSSSTHWIAWVTFAIATLILLIDVLVE